jgi:EAL domain-containing protein (putative c-di-GMP-specific phosphodiesterase class I)
VETRGQFDAIRAMGCERVQGYLFGRPVEATVLEDLLGVPVLDPARG